MQVITKNSSLPKFKVVFLGESGVGKTSLCRRLTNNEFNDYSESTIGATFVSYRNDKACLEIWDTAGQERYRSLVPMYYRGAHACIMVYDVTNRLSFKKLRDWIAAIYEKKEDPLVLLIGNKIDSKEREVTSNQGTEYAEMVGALHFEASAKSGENVKHAIDKMIHQLFLREATGKLNPPESLNIGGNDSFRLNKKLNSRCC